MVVNSTPYEKNEVDGRFFLQPLIVWCIVSPKKGGRIMEDVLYEMVEREDEVVIIIHADNDNDSPLTLNGDPDL